MSSRTSYKAAVFAFEADQLPFIMSPTVLPRTLALQVSARRDLALELLYPLRVHIIEQIEFFEAISVNNGCPRLVLENTLSRLGQLLVRFSV